MPQRETEPRQNTGGNAVAADEKPRHQEDEPQEQGEVPRKRDDSEDDEKGPYRESK